MKLSDGKVLIFGTVKFSVCDKKGAVVKQFEMENSITEGLFVGICGLININNSTDAGKIFCEGIDFYTSESGAYRTGSTPVLSSGGVYNTPAVAHYSIFTADYSVETVKRIRMRRTGFQTADLANNLMLAHVTNLTIAMSSGWTLKADWEITAA